MIVGMHNVNTPLKYCSKLIDFLTVRAINKRINCNQSIEPNKSYFYIFLFQKHLNIFVTKKKRFNKMSVRPEIYI
jgi:hypothetical protein